MIEINVFSRALRKTGAIALLFLFLAFSSQASESDRISLLEKDVQELKQRLLRLEAPQVTTSNKQKPLATNEGWKHLANWRALKKGMSVDEVRGVLGEPARVQGGTLAYWFYPNRSEVMFYEDKLDRWSEPK